MKREILVCGLIALFMLMPATGISSYVGEDIKAVLTDDAHSVPHEPEFETRDLGDLQFIWGVENQTSDFQSIGCECNDTHFFVTGGNNGNDPNKVYIFDFNGNYINSFDQQGTTGWGWLDLAWDGQYFYGGPEAGSQIDVFTDDGTIVDTIPGPVPWCAGLAYDPETDHLWTIDKWTDKVLYEIDKNGNIINSYSQDKNVYGLAWDNVSSYGPFLWVAVQDPQCTFYQFDPSVGDYTGVSFEAYNPGSIDNKACGLGFTTAWNASAGVLFGIQQCDQTPDGPGDQLAGYTITEYQTDTTPPVTTCTLDGEMHGDDYVGEVTVTLTAIDDMSGVNYTMYKVDDGDYNTYDEPFVVSGEGDRTVYFYSVDKAGNVEEEKTCEFTIVCPVEIEISGGFGVSVDLTNILDEDLTNISWSIVLEGGLIILGKNSSGTVDILAGETVTIKSKLILGFGKPTITVTIDDCDPVSTSGFVFLFFVLGV